MYSKNNDFFQSIDLDSIAKSTKFHLRTARKISPSNLLLSFFMAYSNHKFSLRSWAYELSNLIQSTVSFQAIDKKLTIRHLAFFKEVFAQSLRSVIHRGDHKIHKELGQFNRILVEDSTCIKLNKSFYSEFSGVSNGTWKNATCRIQLCMDLKTNGIENIALTSYSHNDSSYSESILDRVTKNDLILRDLGYWKFTTLYKIGLKGAYYVSKLRVRTAIYKANGSKYDFIGFLKNLDKKGKTEFDKEYYIGKKIKFPVRILGKKMSTKETRLKMRQAKRNRHKTSTISQLAIYFYSWNIVITNIPKEKLDYELAVNIYRLRWQIEMFIKNWKSNFNIEKLLIANNSPCREKLEIKLLLSMIYMTTVYQPFYNYCSKKIAQSNGKILSPLKFSQFMKEKFDLLKGLKDNLNIKIMSKYFCYDERKDRNNYYQNLALLYLS